MPDPGSILILDHVTMVKPGVVLRVLTIADPYMERVGALCMSGEERLKEEHGCGLTMFRYNTFSGCLNDARIIKGALGSEKIFPRSSWL